MKNLRGFKDILNKEKKKKINIFSFLNKIFSNNNFYKIETPILEKFKIFNKKNNIFLNEIYKFYDYSKKLICLRPENTSSCIRLYLRYNKKIKIFYNGEMFRYEKPQLNKLRQFNQFGFEIYDNEILNELKNIKLTKEILFFFKKYTLELNIIFNYKFKKIYLNLLIYFIENKFNYYIKKKIIIFKILENKKFIFKKFLFNYKFINIYKKKYINNLLYFLKKKIIFNPKMLRGINYYSNLVFEFKNKKFTVCGGGEYSYYISSILKKKIFSLGLSIGIERLYYKKKYKKKFFKIKTDLNIKIKKIFFSKKFENIKIFKINVFLIEIIFRKKKIIFKKKNILFFIKKINNEKI